MNKSAPVLRIHYEGRDLSVVQIAVGGRRELGRTSATSVYSVWSRFGFHVNLISSL